MNALTRRCTDAQIAHKRTCHAQALEEARELATPGAAARRGPDFAARVGRLEQRVASLVSSAAIFSGASLVSSDVLGSGVASLDPSAANLSGP